MQQTPDVDEQVLGVIDYLPGCHQYGANTDVGQCNKRPDLLSPSTAYEGDCSFLHDVYTLADSIRRSSRYSPTCWSSELDHPVLVTF